MDDKDKFKRLVAIKTNINNLNSAEYIEEKENESNYLLTKNQEKIFRINLVAIVLKIEQIGNITNILLDDGSGNIIMRLFEDNNLTKELNVGDSILTIGRVRMYNKEKYIYPEIIKKISPKWLKLRSIEFGVNEKVKETVINDNKNINNDQTIENKKDNNLDKDIIREENASELNQQNKNVELIEISEEKENIEEVTEIEEITEEDNIDEDQPTFFDPSDKIISLIKKLDEGNGAMIEDVIEKANIEGSEKIIQNMIESGDIYQNLPGRVKIL